jgi:threonine dehydratase
MHALTRAEAGTPTIADVIAGQGTVALEMLEAAPALDTLVVPVGGAG